MKKIPFVLAAAAYGTTLLLVMELSTYGIGKGVFTFFHSGLLFFLFLGLGVAGFITYHVLKRNTELATSRALAAGLAVGTLSVFLIPVLGIGQVALKAGAKAKADSLGGKHLVGRLQEITKANAPPTDSRDWVDIPLDKYPEISGFDPLSINVYWSGDVLVLNIRCSGGFESDGWKVFVPPVDERGLGIHIYDGLYRYFSD